MDELDGGVGLVLLGLLASAWHQRGINGGGGSLAYDLLASWAGALEVGYRQVGIVNFEARRELFCGEGRDAGEGAAE